MNYTVFFLLLAVLGTAFACRSKKINDDTTTQTFRILFQPGVVPEAILFAPAYQMQRAQPVNRAQNEWLITLQAGTRSLAEAPSFLRQLPSVVFIIDMKGTGNTQSKNTDRAKVKIHND